MRRTVFFISDGTAITTETVGHSLLTQFPGISYRQIRIPFVDSPSKAAEAAARIDRAAAKDGAAPIAFISIIDDQTRAVFQNCSGITLDLFANFLDTLERALGVARESSVGRAHGVADVQRYEDRIEATNYALTHDDGVSLSYDNADLILVGISRTGKTPTCLYMALHFGVKAANYPLTDTDLEAQRLPAHLRESRRPGSSYASLRRCHQEVEAAESLLRAQGVEVFVTTNSSIEEIASRILVHFGMQREMF
jgi:regulator of PEP synthase PpsR (kinase-PPPase family)